MPARELIGSEFTVLATAKLVIAAPATTALDFGTPDNLYLPALVGYDVGHRLVLAVTAATGGTASTLTVLVQDAPDLAGAIDTGNLGTAVTDGTLALGTGDGFTTIGIRPQNGRPWLKVSVVHATATDSFAVAVMLLGVPSGL